MAPWVPVPDRRNTEDELDCLSVVKSAIATNDKSFIISALYRVDNALGVIFQKLRGHLIAGLAPQTGRTGFLASNRRGLDCDHGNGTHLSSTSYPIGGKGARPLDG